MRNAILPRTLIAAALVVTTASVSATHLIGGNLGYTYLGETAPGSQVFRYRVTMQFYLNCGSDSNWPTLGSILNSNNGVLPVGVYPQDPNNPNANKPLQTIVNLALVDSALIVPNLPSGCTVGANLCTKLGLLQGTVDLPLNFGGYHLYFQMFARNISITNLLNPNNTGIGYYAFIPPPLLPNSSPIWLGDPVPLLCINDTSTFINSASDPDGDLLIFSFEVPYNSVNAGGGIIPPPNTLPNNIPLVNYVPGYSVTQPFGAGGYSFINGATGLTSYVPTQQGNYVVAVEVKEYRNGVLIGRTRRDLQLQAVVCPPNNAPNTVGAQPTVHTVQAGDPICFDLLFQDPEGDSLFVTSSGTIFDPNLFNPPATIGTPAAGNGTVGTTFCWDTDCGQAQLQPYLFTVSVTDNGCPPRTLDVVHQVYVNGFTGPTSINGQPQVCAGATGVNYSTQAIGGATYAWSVTGGTIASGQGGNSITVNWGATGPGSVQVVAVNAQGCPGATLTIPITITPLPAVNAGADVLICPGAATVIGGSPTGPPGSTYAWAPAAGLSGTSTANPNASPTATTTYVVQVTANGCSATDTVTVTVANPAVNAGNNAQLCTGGSAPLNASGNGTFSWSPPDGLSATNIPNPVASPATTTTYTVTLTDVNGCTASGQVTVTVNPLPTVNAGADVTPCANTTVTLGGAPTGPPGSTYAWSPATGLNNTTLANPTLTVTADATYTVTVTDANGCVNTDAVSVTVLPVPAVDAGPDFTICAGETVQLQGSGTGTLLWTPAAGLSDPTVPDPFCSPEITTTYTLTVTGSNTCTNSDQATVLVNVLPSANAGPDKSICLGGSVTIGTPGPGTFAWSPATGLSATDVATPIASPTVTTTYVVTLTDAQTCTAQDSMTVTVNVPPMAGEDGGATVCSTSGPTDLSTLLGGTPSPGGTWSPAATHVPGSGSQVYSYITPGAPPCPNDTAFVTITEVAAPNAGSDASTLLCSTDAPIDLFTLLGSQAQPGGTWNGPGGPASNIFTPGTSIPGAYTYTVPGTAPCANDDAQVTVTVEQTADAGLSASSSICGSGQPVDLFTLLGGTPQTGGQWTGPNGLPHGPVFDPATHAPGTYTYTVGAQTNCPASAQVVMQVSNPTVQIDGDNTICSGESTVLTGSGGVLFTWSPTTGVSDPTAASPVFTPSASTTYTLTVTDAAGCSGTAQVTLTVFPLPVANAGPDVAYCPGGSAVIGGSPTGPPGSTFVWSPATGLSSTNTAAPTASPASTTTYTVTVTSSDQCSATDTVTVTVHPQPFLDAGPDVPVCLGSGVQLNANGAGTFQWSPITGLSDPTLPNPVASPAVNTTYTVTLTDANGCSTSDALVVTVNPLPEVNAGPDTWLCAGSSTALNGSGGPGSFAWSPAASLDDPTTSSPVATPPVTTTYTLTITDGNGCQNSDAVLVTVGTDPPIDAGPDRTSCAGHPVTLGGSPTSVPGSSYGWSPPAGLDDPGSPNPIATPAATTVYTLTVSNDTCTSTASVTVTIVSQGDAGFTARFEARCESLKGFFTDTSTGAVAWHWDFGNGGTSSEQHPQAELPYGQSSTVTLVITDAGGCTDTTSQTFTMESYAELVDVEVPNVISPNGDGVNDVFTPITDAFLGACTTMDVMNRWGQIVFTSQGNNITWDGRTVAGEPCVPGTYFYVVSVKDLRFKGTLTLVR